MDTLGTLKIFVHAADARSFTAAARRLGLSSSAVGKAILRLEEHLGARLLHRSTRTVTLTPEGARFLERSRRILGEFELAAQELSATRDTPAGPLRISLPIVGMLMMPALTAFMQTYPAVQLDLDFTDRLVDVIDEGFDVVIRAGDVSDSRLMTRALGPFHLILVCSDDYIRQRGTPQMPEDLQRHACLHHRFATSSKLERWPLVDAGSPVDIDLPQTAVANTIEPLIDMVAAGLGIACLPDFAVREQLQTGEFRIVLEDFSRHEAAFRLLWPSSRHMSSKLRAFVDFMGDNLFAKTYGASPLQGTALSTVLAEPTSRVNPKGRRQRR